MILAFLDVAEIPKNGLLFVHKRLLMGWFAGSSLLILVTSMPHKRTQQRYRGFNLEERLDCKVRQLAAMRDITITEWLNEAVEAQLQRENVLA